MKNAAQSIAFKQRSFPAAAGGATLHVLAAQPRPSRTARVGISEASCRSACRKMKVMVRGPSVDLNLSADIDLAV